MKYKTYRGDSLDLNKTSPFFWDHVVRYWWANSQAKDKKVLDCATGKGYGAYIISQSAKSVVGIDLNENSLKIASDSFNDVSHLKFKKQDVFKLEELNEKFDLITAFEIIEHLEPKRTKEFLLSLKNALAPNGILLLSTPNHDVVLKSGVHLPSFHINNYKSIELKKILEEVFPNVTMIGQFKKRKGINQILFDIDFLNLRHLIKNLFNKKKVISDHPDENEDSHDVFQGQKLSKEDFNSRPTREIEEYSFSSKHFRQAGLTIAICKT